MLAHPPLRGSQSDPPIEKRDDPLIAPVIKKVIKNQEKAPVKTQYSLPLE